VPFVPSLSQVRRGGAALAKAGSLPFPRQEWQKAGIGAEDILAASPVFPVAGLLNSLPDFASQTIQLFVADEEPVALHQLDGVNQSAADMAWGENLFSSSEIAKTNRRLIAVDQRPGVGRD